MNAPQRIVILTGAGISAESGVRTFRDQNGLWEDHRIEDVASYEGFLRNPALVHQFYNQRRRQLEQVSPNAAHLALARWEQHHQGEFLLITQNVDDLHQRAGSKKMISMHGELRKARCQSRDKVIDWHGETSELLPCPVCQKVGCLRPHIVWFGEMPLLMPEIEKALRQCDLFVAIGTSAMVYPAALFIQWVRREVKAHTIEINLQETPASDYFHRTILGKATEQVPLLLKELNLN